MPGVNVDLMLRALRPGADSAVGLAAGAGSHGAGRQGEASDSDPVTVAEYVTHCPKIFVR
jgi:putative effector of murein hydrolase